MEMFKEEQEHLEETTKIIESELEKSKKELNRLINLGKTLSFEDRQRGQHFNVNSQAEMTSHRIGILERSKPIPYFGRMDIIFDDNPNEERKMYIGRSGITSDGKIIVTDWRAPVSSIYYDSENGRVSYNAPDGEFEASLLGKRQINIHDGVLIDVQDSSLVTNDELLKPYLEVSADNRMKTIIASIQHEQNTIIRNDAYENMIIQGVAGSGKTSVALHRIAYLIYALGNKISSDSFLVLGPNDYFLDYVSTVLPDLETTPVKEETLINYVKEYINEKVSLNDELTPESPDFESLRNIQSLKTSLYYEKLLDSFLDKYILDGIIPYDFKIQGEVIFDKEQIRKYLFAMNSRVPNYDKLGQLMIHDLKNNYEKIYSVLNDKYKKIYMNMDFDDPKRKEVIERSSALYNDLKNNGQKLVKKYIKDIKLSVLDLYSLFICYLETEDLPISDKESQILQKTTLSNNKKKKVGFEDLAALLHIKYKLSNHTNDYKQIIIDEAQDYGLFHFRALKETNPNSIFSIYGDLAQAIYSYRSIDNWEEVNENVFDNKGKMLHLDKSYRTTIEITNNANEVLNHLQLQKANPVVRHGQEVEYLDSSSNGLAIIDILDLIHEKQYETIAIICKEEKEAKKVYKRLIDSNIECKYISNEDHEYDKGILIMTASSSKGLEFDAVIINDASENVYDSSSDVDMHLLYVASTRALHDLYIVYNKKLVEVYEDIKNQNEEKKYSLKM